MAKLVPEKNIIDRKYLKGNRPLTVLSLGAGIQSTVMALMAEVGYEGLTKPDLAIFADTGWEPPAVYEHLEWLRSQLSYEVVTVSAGNIREDLLLGRNPRGHKFMDIPTYLTEPDGKAGIAKRQCTSDYKLDPIKKELRQRLGLERGRRAPKSRQVEMWLGISVDESSRQKPAARNGLPTVGRLLSGNTAGPSSINGSRNATRKGICPAAPASAVPTTATANGSI